MSPGRRYSVSTSGAFRDRLRELLADAAAAGVFDRVEAALRTIEDRLAADPVGWGDPIYRLHAAKVMVYHRLYDELSVVYGIPDGQQVVFLNKLRPVLRHPLADGRA
ncbi:MAG: hypothetical protein K2X87_27570 [Gemmataceae bacterium]|nr:hypothetical protein [Gemmataceae bacterium]